MQKFMDWIKQPFKPVQPLTPGLYHYQSPPEDPLNYRLHLRVEPNGSSLLIINAATVLHLNQTATEYAYHIVQHTPHDEAVKAIRNRYQVSTEEIERDFTDLIDQINNLILTQDLDPVTHLDMERQAPYTQEVSAPYRLDCALTYQLGENNAPESAPHKRVDRELTTQEWKQILQKAWQAGIPHVLFTGGEPTLRTDLVELLQYVEELGQVSGILTDGLKLGDTKYLKSLLDAGLDHTMIILQPSKENSWESLANFSYWSQTLDEDIFVAAHLTLTEDNKENFNALIDKLAETDISAISISANDKRFSEQLADAQNHAYAKDLELIWDIPVPYSSINPISLELEQADDEVVPEGAGRGWLYVEPDGDVLPGQGINHVLGNLLTDDWQTIWDAAKAFMAS